jgi:signal transduction histidine kinase
VPGTENSGSNLVPQGIGIIGVLLTSLLFLYLISTHNRRRLIEATVTERTAELSATNTSLKNEVRQRRRVEHELRAAKDQAEIANRTKSEFLAMISHELRTPLNAILGFSEILSSEMFGKLGDSKYRGYAEDIMSSGEHLLGLINNILDLSKVEAREFELDDEELDISEAINEALRFVADKAKEMKISVKTDIPAYLPLLRADERAIRQILINLLSNAVKFTPERGRVIVGAEIGGNGSFVLSVSDTGIGIPADHIERVLQPFAQVDTSLARKFEGTGLGLPLTKSLVELHGGILELDSRPDEGTTVRVIFDRSRVVESLEAAE